jgi:hypothetical protein
MDTTIEFKGMGSIPHRLFLSLMSLEEVLEFYGCYDCDIVITYSGKDKPWVQP